MKAKKTSQSEKLSMRVIVVWFIAILFSAFQFCAQVIAGPMTMEIMQAFGLNALTVSYAVSSFFYVYIAMQLPAGLLLDRYSNRILMPLAFVVCAFGSIFMGMANDVYNFSIARMLCAFGGSFGFIGAMRILRNYVPMSYIPLFIGLTEMQGFIVTCICESLVSYYLPLLGFKQVLFNFGVIGLFLAILVFIALHPTVAPKHEYAPIAKGALTRADVINLLLDKQIWLLGIIGFGFFSLVTSFAALWGVPALISIHSLSLQESTHVISAIFLGIAFGGPILGHLSKDHDKQKKLVFWCGLICAGLLLIVIETSNLGFILLCTIMFLLGMFSCCYLLCFAIGNEIVPSKLSGTCMGFINMVTMLSALILQPFMGYLISLNGPMAVVNGAPIYAPSSYKISCYALVLIFVLVSMLSTRLQIKIKT